LLTESGLGHFTTVGWHFFQGTVTGTAPMMARTNSPALPGIGPSASLTFPSIFGQALYGIFEGVVNCDVQSLPIHLGHLAAKVCSMVRAAFEDVKLPLMNHLVGQRVHQLFMRLRFQQGRREADHAQPALR
jgi:hypothetical protein